MTDATSALKNVREKFPGAYDDLDDATLLGKLKAKYPDYADLELPKAESSTILAPPPPLTFGQYFKMPMSEGGFGGQELIGAGKEALNRAYQVARLPSALEAKALVAVAPKSKTGDEYVAPPLIAPTPEALRPTNEGQVLGQAFERIAETLLAPEMWGAKLPLVLSAINGMATQAGVNWLQGGTPEQIAAAAALSLGKPMDVWMRRNPATVKWLVDRAIEHLPKIAAGYSYLHGGAESGFGGWLAGKVLRGIMRAKPAQAAGQWAADKAAQMTSAASNLLPALAQPEISLPSEPPKGKIVIRRPGQSPEIVDVEVDEQGRVRIKK